MSPICLGTLIPSCGDSGSIAGGSVSGIVSGASVEVLVVGHGGGGSVVVVVVVVSPGARVVVVVVVVVLVVDAGTVVVVVVVVTGTHGTVVSAATVVVAAGTEEEVVVVGDVVGNVVVVVVAVVVVVVVAVVVDVGSEPGAVVAPTLSTPITDGATTEITAATVAMVALEQARLSIGEHGRERTRRNNLSVAISQGLTHSGNRPGGGSVRPAWWTFMVDGDEPQAAEPEPRRDAVLAIDIGARRFTAGLITLRGELLDRSIAEVEPDVGPQSHFAGLARIVGEQLDQARDQHGVRVRAIGVGCPGPIERHCETVSPASVPSWRRFELRQHLRDLTQLPAYGDLDAKALTLAEGWLGAARGVRSFCTINVSTNVSGGLVLDGDLVDGAGGNAGHIGHLIVEPGGRRCGCGARGCLDAEVSGSAIAAMTGRPVSEPTYDLMRRSGMLVGRAASMVCTTLDLDLVVVGGHVALGFAATFFNAAQEEIDATARVGQGPKARVTPARLGDRGPIVGAGAIAIRGMRRSRA
jgi:glucokinase